MDTRPARPGARDGREAAARTRDSEGADRESGGRRRTILVAVGTKLLGLLALLGILGLLYDGAAAPAFRVQQVAVSGNHLLSPEEIVDAAAVQGMNVFWLSRSEVAERIRRLPAARTVEVRVALPGRVDLRVEEREAFVGWHSGESTFLVDSEGLILGTQTPAQPLVVVYDLDAPALNAGERIDPSALATVAALSRALPGAIGLSPGEYDYSRALGVELQEPNGPRLRFGTSEQLDLKLATLVAVKAELARNGTRPQVIDVRFPSRPYYR